MKTRIKVIAILFFVLAAASCNSTSKNYNYQVPAQTNDGLQVESLEKSNIDSTLIIDAAKRIERGKYGEIHSMLIYKNDKLVFEDYFEGHKYQWDASGHKGEYVSWDKNTPHVLQSASKSFVSICFGIAVEKGFIESIDQSIFDYLPDYQNYNADNKNYVTIKTLLTMTSGFLWDEWGVALSSTQNDAIGIYFSEKDPVEFVLERPLIAVPGTHFTYSGGDMQILEKILKNATGMNIDEFSEKYLFEPLGIESNDWWLRYDTGEISTGGGLKLTPRDMLKVGVLFLNDGVWNGEQIISKEWVEKCGHPFGPNYGINIPGEDLGTVGYGYTWWTKQDEEYGRMYCALGWGGQKIMLFPDLNAVVVFTGANFKSKVKQNRILENFVLPALQ
ncbi:serine hydrolase [uncultured Draconibacterium sp.]|uniref:serine hydrolase domain-containing protein n=1 Tax=uncultured Draconibacterium sp. TaxID=1573823 RepID=UPI002AA8BC72|nr:serine hydrolase [uncultured Draconibacterium sp.]